MKRSTAGLFWGGVSALVGLLSILPSFPVFPRRGLALAQLRHGEPGLAMASRRPGWHGLRGRSWRAVLLGLIGWRSASAR